MEASATLRAGEEIVIHTNPGLEEGPGCHVCGYSRRGLPSGARCPECGEPPSPAVGSTSQTAGPVARTHAERAWLLAVTLGLGVLLYASAAAMRVALVMPLDGLSLPALNVPAPKLWAASLIQRSIGGRPGPWGVAGTLAVLGCVLGVWLLTESPSVKSPNEPALSLRRLTRWATPLLAGAMLGVLLGGYDVSRWRWRGYTTWEAVLVATAAVELPVNALLYLYLGRLAQRLGARRAGAALEWSAWLVPAVTTGAVALVFAERSWDRDQPPATWKLVQAAYGAAALAVGATATAAVVLLFVRAAAAGASDWLASATASAGASASRVRRGLHTAADAVRADPLRWVVLLGLVLFVYNRWSLTESALSISPRNGLGGNVPFLKFPGPKVSLAPLVNYTEAHVQYALETVFVVWLMTVAWKPPGKRPRWAGGARLGARWTTVVLVGAAVGWRLASRRFERYQYNGEHAAVLILAGEAPATFLLYLHLAALAAAGAPRAARGIVTLACVVAVVIVLPIAFFVLAAPLQAMKETLGAYAASAAYTAAALAVGLLAVSAVARVAWGVVNQED